MAAGAWSFTIEQNSVWERVITLTDATGTPVDLSGYGALLQVRPSVESESVLVELSTEDGQITIPSPTTGQMILRLTTAATAALDWDGGAPFDLVLSQPDEERVRVLEGLAYLSPAVSR